MNANAIFDKIEKAGTGIADSASNVGKIYGVSTNFIIIIICIVVLVFSSKLIINNSKYIETEGTVVKVEDVCGEDPIYDENHNKVGTSLKCKTVIKYKLKVVNANAVQMKQYSLPFRSIDITEIKLGYNENDGFYYREFILNKKYSVGNTLSIFYFSADPFNSSTTSYFPTFFGWIGIIVSSFIILGCILKIILLFKFKFLSTIEGLALGKRIFFGK
jgi:hypothetical protein